MPGIRTFIAIELSSEARQVVSGLVDRLEPSGADVRWIPPGNLHLTLKFLGDVEDRRLDRIAERVREASSGIGAFTLALSGVGAFPSREHPRVYWVGLSGGVEAIRELARRMDAAFEADGVKREGREFAPHLTIGRVRSPRGLAPLASSIDRISFLGPEMVVDQIAVFKSDLRPAGPIYTRLAAVQLVSPGKSSDP